jgi:VanZ family protein
MTVNAGSAGDGLARELRGRVLWLALDRPRASNAVDGALARAFSAALVRAATDPAVAAVVMTGGGDRVFSAGIDVKNPSDHQDQALPHLDKLAHAAAFAGLATLVLAGAAGWWRPGVGLGLAVIGLLALYAGLDEFTQGFVQLREPDVRDWVADMLGVLVGTAVFFQGWKLVRRGRATRLTNQSGVSR